MPNGHVSDDHEEVADKTADMLEVAGFEHVDREVNVLGTVGGLAERANLDVCAMYKDALLIVEVKTGANVDFRREIPGWRDKKRVIENFRALRVENSRRGQITTNRIRLVRAMTVVFLCTAATPGPEYKGKFKREKIENWDSLALASYTRTAKSLGPWTRHEIMYDVGLSPSETQNPVRVRALEAEQPGGKYYLSVMKPAELLRIAYIYRRRTEETLSYQRIVRQKKIEAMTAFLRRSHATLPNNVIVAIDPDVASEVRFDGQWLNLSGRYCSAWVVDGQHRLYGFVGTRYSNPDNLAVFQIPVVIFDSLSTKKQTAMFIDINNNQKKIDPTLLSDLATVLQDLSRKETWPSMIAKALSESGPFYGLVRTYESTPDAPRRPISLAGLSKFELTRTLLAPKIVGGKIDGYTGPLFNHSSFNWHHSAKNEQNKQALAAQVGLLNRFFGTVQGKLGTAWADTATFQISTYTGVNALLLLLNKVMLTGRTFDELDLDTFLEPLGTMTLPWVRGQIRKYSNYPGFAELANMIIERLNVINAVKLIPYPSRTTITAASPAAAPASPPPPLPPTPPASP